MFKVHNSNAEKEGGKGCADLVSPIRYKYRPPLAVFFT